MQHLFPFLAPLVELHGKISELEGMAESRGLDMGQEVALLRAKWESESRRIFADLTPWQRVQLSRHPGRPQSSDYIDHMLTDWVPLAGDRMFGDDAAILCGMGRLLGRGVMLIGQEKGHDLNSRRACNFGMPHPEGYRKAMHKMRTAERFGLPVVCLVNTPGAFPGIEAEERGQSIAIAENIRDMAGLRTPIVVVVIGEGGSGGALGIGVGDRMLMPENSYFSVISPEGCAAILWKDGAKRDLAAAQLGLTGESLRQHGICDEVIPEPAGGGHVQPVALIHAVRDAVARHLDELCGLDEATLMAKRYAKLRAIGTVIRRAS